ncbi:MAG: hypothetical protein ACRC62_10795 [Microcoleus sp.]
MKIAEVKNFVTNLILEIVARCDQKVAEAKAIADEASAKAATLSSEVSALKTALDEANNTQALALANQADQTSSELDQLTTDLAAQFANPTPTADVVNEIVAADPVIETITEVAPEVGTETPTPEAVTEASVEAIGEVIEGAEVVE